MTTVPDVEKNENSLKEVNALKTRINVLGRTLNSRSLEDIDDKTDFKKIKVGGLFRSWRNRVRLSKVGFEISWANEIDKKAYITYRANFNPCFKRRYL